MKDFGQALFFLTVLTTVTSSSSASASAQSTLNLRQFQLQEADPQQQETDVDDGVVVVDGEKFFKIDVPGCATGICLVQINTTVQVCQSSKLPLLIDTMSMPVLVFANLPIFTKMSIDYAYLSLLLPEAAQLRLSCFWGFSPQSFS